MADTNAMAQWISENKNNSNIVGGPEWVGITSAYRDARAAERAAQQTAPTDTQAYSDQGIPIGGNAETPPAATSDPFGSKFMMALGAGPNLTGPASPPPPEGVVSFGDAVNADRADESPYSWQNRADRLITSRIAAYPDTAAAVVNAGSRALTGQDAVGYLAPWLRANAGAKELPADAPWYDRYGEGLAGGILSSKGLRGVGASITGMLGSEAGQKLGEAIGIDPQTLALLGGVAGAYAPRGAENAVRAGTRYAYSDSGAPNAAAVYDAADRANTRPTPGMLGDRDIRATELQLAGRKGSGPIVGGGRDMARDQFTNAAREVVDATGATSTRPTVVGRDARDTANAALTDLSRRSSTNQQLLEDTVGSRTPIDVANLDRLMTRTTRTGWQGNTTPEVAAPIEAKLATLRSMYEPPGDQGPRLPQVSYGQFKDWNSNLRKAVDNFQPMTEHQATPIRTEARNAMQNAATQQGVPSWMFNSVQGNTRRLEGEGGHRDVLGPVADRGVGKAYNYLLKGGEGDPDRLVDYRNSIRASAGAPAGDAAVNRIYGGHLGNILEQTLLHRNESALGPTDFARYIRNVDPQSLEQYAGGARGAQRINDVATLAQAFHYPTRATGGTSALNNALDNAAGTLTKPAIAAGTAALGGADAGASAVVAGLASRMPWHPFNKARANILTSDAALAGMAGRPTPFLPHVQAGDIRSALNAIEAMQSYPAAER